MTCLHDELIPTRRSLLKRLKDWDDDLSWRDFFHTYWKLIYGAAIRAGLTRSEAEDVVQETVLTVCKKIKALKYDPALGSFKGWLLHTTRWRIADQYRKRLPTGNEEQLRRRQGPEAAVLEEMPDPAGFDLESVWNEEWEKNLTDAAIDRVKKRVSARQFQIFDLYVMKQWPVGKVTRALNVSVAQVYLAKHRISGLLKQQFKELETKLM